MSAFGDAGAVTPEVNHTLMSTGDLGASLMDAVAGYECVADMLMAELTAMGLNTSSTAVVGWQGVGGEMMQMTAAQFMAVCEAASAWVRIGQTQAGEVAAAHASAVNAMIPAEVCVTNRTTQAGLVATNPPFMQNTPAILMLDAQYGEFWVQNATQRTGYGAVVTQALDAIAVPAPFSPAAANPAAAAAGAGEDAAQSGMQGALQASSKATQAADDPAKDAMAGPSSAEGLASSMAGQLGGVFGQVGSEFGQFTQIGGQLPSMLGQAPQMFSGLLGPLSSMNGATLAPEAAGAAGAPMAGLGGVGALAGAGGGGGGMVSGSSALSSTFVRPASSFSSPATPTLPAGWQGGGSATEASQARPAGMGGGGLYGAPAAMGREGGSGSADKPNRTMQVTARPSSNGGERQRI
jgi:PPE-repeat protein